MRPSRPCRRREPRFALAAVATAIAVAAAGCGSSAPSGSSASPPPSSGGSGTSGASSTTTAPSGATHGPVTVLSAGSLDTLLTKAVAPAFHAATGYTLNDVSMGSSDLAAAIKSKTQVADVFISASAAVNTTLEGKANGDWVSWYATFAASPLVLAYYPKGRFATDLRTKPWYTVLAMPGFRLGRTNPAEDPAGVLAREALLGAASAHHLPALRTLGTEAGDEYQESTYQGLVAAGQLDGALMYLADANSAGLPHVPLTGTNFAGDYTITVVNRTPHTAGAVAFIKFLLGPTGRAEMKADQFELLTPPRVTGTGVPGALTSILGS